MRIVFFIDHLRLEGTQRFVARLAQGLSARGHTIAIVCWNDASSPLLIEALEQQHIRVWMVGRRGLLGGYGLVTLYRWLRANQFDVAVTLLLYSDILGRILAWVAGIPWIVTSIRSINSQYSAMQLFLLRCTMPLAQRIVLNGAHTRSFAINQEGAHPDRIVVIPNGFAIEILPPGSPSLHTLCNLSETTRLVGAVGRLTHEKGHDILIEAFARVQIPDTVLLLIGDGADRLKLEVLVAKLGISDRVIFMGIRSDAAARMQELSVFVHPSRREGQPNALLEAMTAGCAIVASAIPGHAELIDDGLHGWLVPSEDPAAFAAAIQLALADPAEAAQRGAAARLRAEQEFGLATMVNRWETVLQLGRIV